MALFKRIVGYIFVSIGLLCFALAIAMIFDNEIKEPIGVSIFTSVVGAIFLTPGVLLLKKKSNNLPKISKQERMEQAFYAALQNGSMATIADYEFAVQNKVTRKEAREFLEQKALELGASADANDRGMVTYTFGG